MARSLGPPHHWVTWTAYLPNLPELHDNSFYFIQFTIHITGTYWLRKTIADLMRFLV